MILLYIINRFDRYNGRPQPIKTAVGVQYGVPFPPKFIRAAGHPITANNI